MLSDLMKEDLIKGLLDIFSGDIEAIILYSSVARKESTPESDKAKSKYFKPTVQ